MTERAGDMGSVELAKPENFAELKSLLDKANDYSLAVSGSQAWKNVEIAYSDLKGEISRGECFVLRGTDGSVVASIGLSETDEQWGERGHDGRALYFSKFMKDPDKTQPGEGQSLVYFAAQEASRRNRDFLRCDIVTDQPHILAYYSKLGFISLGKFIYKPSGREGAFLEAPVQVVLDYLRK